jgi:hypothetical protein
MKKLPHWTVLLVGGNDYPAQQAGAARGKGKVGPGFCEADEDQSDPGPLLPGFSVRLGSATSIDVTKPGIDKAYGIRKLHGILGISLNEMFCIGDAMSRYFSAVGNAGNAQPDSQSSGLELGPSADRWSAL